VKYLPTNTLAHFNAAPHTKPHNLSGLPTAVFAEATKLYRQTCGTMSPQDEAVTFYALNHAAGIIRKLFTPSEPLPECAQTIMAEHTTTGMNQGKRMLHYILLVTTREMRHLSESSVAPAFWNTFKLNHGPVSVDYIKNIASDGSETTAMGKYLNHPPNLTIEEFTKALSYAFHESHGFGGGFGGHPWGSIADAAHQMVTGAVSMETMVDTGYALAHNNGPMFNKGLMYDTLNKHLLLTILDVQRAGQIPNLLLDSGNVGGVIKPTAAKATVQLIAQQVPAAFKGWVDWHLVDAMRPSVEKLESPHKYDALKAAQLKLHPDSKPALPQPVVKTLGGQKIKITGELVVFPATSGKPAQVVPTFERVS